MLCLDSKTELAAATYRNRDLASLGVQFELSGHEPLKIWFDLERKWNRQANLLEQRVLLAPTPQKHTYPFLLLYVKRNI